MPDVLNVDTTKPHQFIECFGYGQIGSTCPKERHCLCGEKFDDPIHEIQQDAGGLL